jgi:cytochrome c biogenesis factor
MTVTKRPNFGIALQTIILVITLIGIAVSADRRVTVVEEQLKAEVAVRNNAVIKHEAIIAKLQENEERLIENQARVMAILEVMDKRHTIEDTRKR